MLTSQFHKMTTIFQVVFCLLVFSAYAADVLYVSYGQDHSCSWPLEWRNISTPYCFTGQETSVNVTSDNKLLWQGYDRPYRHCNSLVDSGALAELDTCTNVSLDIYLFGHYRANTRPMDEIPPVNKSFAALSVNYFTTNACMDAPVHKEMVKLDQCHSDTVYSSYSFTGFRKNATEDILVAEYWDSRHSCNGINRGWSYLRNGLCSQVLFPSPYRSWIAYW